MTKTLGALDGGAKEQQSIVRKAANRLRSLSKAPAIVKFVSQTLEQAQKLQLRNWILSWQLPQYSTTCSANPACVTTSNMTTLSEYRKHNAELRDLTYLVINKIKKLRRGKLDRKESALLVAADKQYKKNDDLSHTVPDLQYACSGAATSR
jgi:hypothetical protein